MVQQQQERSSDFASRVAEWLGSLERALAANRLYQAGEIASFRSGLIAVEQGQIPTGIELRGHASRLRVANAAAAQALQRAAEVASSLLAENQPRLTEAERVAQLPSCF